MAQTQDSSAFLDPFRSASFDPITYLNSTLPPLQTQSQATSSSTTRQSQSQSQAQPAVPLSTLSEQSSSLLARLSAQTTLTSDTLTSLTDDILRGGARLAFEVEMLRAEVVGLEDVWASHSHAVASAAATTDPGSTLDGNSEASTRALAALQTQSAVRTHLESVRRVFDLALSFPLPPNSVLAQLSSAQGTAPADLDSYAYSSGPKLPPPFLPASILEPLQAFLSLPLPSNVSIRTPISATMTTASQVIVSGKLDPVSAVETSLERALGALETAREVCEVWRGTSEEKVRRAVVELWSIAVGERRDVEVRSGRVRVRSTTEEQGEREEVTSGEMEKATSAVVSTGGKGLTTAGTVGASAAKGLLSGLRRLRDEIYLD